MNGLNARVQAEIGPMVHACTGPARNSKQGQRRVDAGPSAAKRTYAFCSCVVLHADLKQVHCNPKKGGGGSPSKGQ